MKEATKTYLEQTKLLVTLSSAFLFAPPALIGILSDRIRSFHLSAAQVHQFLIAEVLFVASVLMGYITVGTIAGSQDNGSFNVYRTETMVFSWLQIFTYLAGLIYFLVVSNGLLSS